MDSKLGAIARSGATSQVLEKLRIHILTNHYEDGEQITETMLAQRYGANRSSVRNALLVLERESLVTVEPNGTKRVCRFTQEDANNLYDLRGTIELGAVRRFYSRENRNYDFALDSMKNASPALQSRDIPAVIRADSDFHCACVRLCGNKAFLQTWIALSATTEALFLLNLNDSEEYREWYMRTFTQRHGELLAALMSDEDKCLSLLSEHIENARKITCGVIRRIEEGKLKIPD